MLKAASYEGLVEGLSVFFRSVLFNKVHRDVINPLNPELNPTCYLLALFAHHFLHVSRIRVKSLTLRLLIYIYIYTHIYIYTYIYIYIYIYIQSVPGGRDKTSGECSLC